jgi:photosystem II stability/assembly factor-like uncharacterized protein
MSIAERYNPRSFLQKGVIIILFIICNSACLAHIDETKGPSSVPTQKPFSPSFPNGFSKSPSFAGAISKTAPTFTPKATNTQKPSPTATPTPYPDEWVRFGPEGEGGYISAAAMDPVDPNVLYAGMQSYPYSAVMRSFLYKSVDGGEHWNRINSGLGKDQLIRKIAVDPLDTETFYMVFYDGSRTTSFYATRSLAKTSDGGNTWNILKVRNVLSFDMDPKNTSLLYAGCENGVYKSKDGGESWNPSGLEGLDVEYIKLDPNKTLTVFAGITDGSVYKSIDGGDSWKIIKEENAIHAAGMVIAFHPSNPEIVYIGTYEGIILSTDGGEKWTDLSVSDDNIYSGIFALIVDPIHTNTVYMGSGIGISKSIDGGSTWKVIDKTLIGQGISPGIVNDIIMDPGQSKTLYLATGSGMYKTIDGGAVWKAMNRGLDSIYEVKTIAINPSSTNIIYFVGLHGLYKSTNRDKDWELIKDARGDIAIDPKNPAVMYQLSGEIIEGGKFLNTVEISYDGGKSWSRGYPITVGVYIDKLVINPAETNILFASAWSSVNENENGVYKSMDSGKSWRRTGLYAIKKGLAVDPKNGSIVYAGTLLGLYKSLDCGETWALIDDGGYFDNNIVIDPLTTTTIYIGYRKSTDGGESWEKMGGGGSFLAIDPFNPDILYAGGESGVTKSMDAGKTWFSIGLQGKTIFTIAIDPLIPEILYAGAEDGMYILRQE